MINNLKYEDYQETFNSWCDKMTKSLMLNGDIFCLKMLVLYYYIRQNDVCAFNSKKDKYVGIFFNQNYSKMELTMYFSDFVKDVSEFLKKYNQKLISTNISSQAFTSVKEHHIDF